MTGSLSSALIVATTGLRAAQTGIDSVTRNVASAQVEGYTRKEVPLETIAFADLSGGVRTKEVIRSVSEALLKQLRDSTSSSDRLTIEDDFLGRFESIFGKPGDQVSISVKLGNLADAYRAMTATPDLATSQLTVLDAAQTVVQNFNFVASNIRALREEADATIASSVDKVNAALTEIADLNLQIATLQAQGRSIAELEDKRDIQINLVAKQMDISYFKRDNGEIYLSTRSGRSILDATYDPNNPPLTFNKTPVILATTGYAPAPATSGLSGVQVEGVDVTTEIGNGRIAGLLNLRDTYLPQTQSQLDELAARLIQHFNFQDMQLFLNGTQALPANLEIQDAGGVAAAATGVQSTVTLQSVTGLSTGMSVRFGNHNSTYQITSIDTVLNTINVAQVGSTTGLTQAVSLNDTVTFGPAIPQVTNQTARAAGLGALAATPIQMTSLVGVQVGTRLKFANHDTLYTVTAVGIAGGLASDQEFLVEPDGTGVGLQAAISAGEAIQIQPPISGVSGISGSISVNPAVVNNPWRTRDGTRVDAPSHLTGDNTIPTNVVSMFETLQTFTNNTGLSSSGTVENFAAGMIGFQANRRSATKTQLDSQSVIRDNFDRRVKDDSGVNVDQELAFMLQVQNSYAASARTISAISEMMDELLRIV